MLAPWLLMALLVLLLLCRLATADSSRRSRPCGSTYTPAFCCGQFRCPLYAQLRLCRVGCLLLHPGCLSRTSCMSPARLLRRWALVVASLCSPARDPCSLLRLPWRGGVADSASSWVCTASHPNAHRCLWTTSRGLWTNTWSAALPCSTYVWCRLCACVCVCVCGCVCVCVRVCMLFVPTR